MRVYRDCTGSIPFSYENEDIEIFGAPGPRDQNNSPISSIVLMPDSQQWLNQRMGDISSDCKDVGGTVFSCSNGDFGSYQCFPYKSAPINLKGTPPSTGWHFRFNL